MDKNLLNVSKGFVGGQYKPLTDEQVIRIHKASLEVLAKTGVMVEGSDALSLFKDSGARVDGSRVWLSESLIEDAVDKAPSRIVLAGRDPEDDLILEDARVHIGTGGAALQVLDLETDKIRPAVLADVPKMARIVDALDNIHFYLLPIYPSDVDEKRVEISKYYHALANTTKHVQGGVYTIQGIRDVIEMSEAIMGSANALRERPVVSFITSWMVSPLKFATDVTNLLLEINRQGLPVVLSSAPMAGSTAPVTLAGMLVQLNAEQLAGLTLTQLANPGCPVLIGPIPATVNLKNGRYLGGGVEMGICNAAITQLAHYYQVPIYNSAGMTESKLPDFQAGIEKTQSVIQVALSGSNFIHHAAGMLEDMATIAYEQFVLDNEVLGMAMRAVRGIEVNPDTLAVEVIDRVGPGNHYLMDDHTLRYMRSEHYFPSPVLDRQSRDGWQKAGAKDARVHAKEMARRILDEHKPDPLNSQVDSYIREKFSSTLVLLE